MKSIDKIIAVAGYVQLVFYIFMLQTWIFDAVFPLSNIRVFFCGIKYIQYQLLNASQS